MPTRFRNLGYLITILALFQGCISGWVGLFGEVSGFREDVSYRVFFVGGNSNSRPIAIRRRDSEIPPTGK